MDTFLYSIKEMVPPDTLAKWDKVKLPEASPIMSISTIQSLFFNLKFNNEIVEAARGDFRAREEVSKLRDEVKSLREDKRKLLDSHKKLFANEASIAKRCEKLLKDREKMDVVVLRLDKDKDEMNVEHGRVVEELKLKVEALQKAVDTYQATQEDGEEIFNAGYAVGIKDYMVSTYDTFPDLQWSLLGPDVVVAIEQIKKERAAAITPESAEAEGRNTEGALADAVPEQP